MREMRGKSEDIFHEGRISLQLRGVDEIYVRNEKNKRIKAANVGNRIRVRQ